MGLVQAYTSLDMFAGGAWYGTVTNWNATTIEITAGDLVGRYSGSFTYDDWGNVFGQLRGYQETLNGRLLGSVTGFNVDAYAFMQAVESGDIERPYKLVLSGADEFRGSSGGDKLGGYGGSDRMYGNGGRDYISGGDGYDSLYGGTGNDKLFGDRGQDRLHAGSGSDVLNGGQGQDRLYGGTDSAGDDFVFSSRSDSAVGTSRDLVYNFTRGADDIDLRGIDARSSTYTNNAFAWAGKTAADHSVWWKAVDAGVLLRADVNGDARPDFELMLLNVTSISSGDVLL